MLRKISILGSTGSIGTQTLDVARNLGIEVKGLAANSNIDILEKQIYEFNPQVVAVMNEAPALELSRRVRGKGVEVLSGMEGFVGVATMEGIDTVVSSIVGIAGLIPTMEAIKSGKDIALANKETLVTAGEIVMSEVKKRKVRLLPVDSEHSAILQSMTGYAEEEVKKIILTASGGPFKGKSIKELEQVTVAQALKHPNWSMGSKITVDSATLMNKGLEVIEAKWLFDIDLDKIEVLIHPQSIIHSMVEYIDGSIIAQLGSPDMRIPIQLALTYPARMSSNFSKLNLLEAGTLTFEPPDCSSFPCLELAYEAIRKGGTMPAVLNAANEVLVSLFLQEKIRFLDIPCIIEKTMGKHTVIKDPDLNNIIDADQWAREVALNIC
ncbi:MAG TPA: 1-deoxy-D-xylulose-5-phosphate reductoisomerase [Clostridia bacterium]